MMPTVDTARGACRLDAVTEIDPPAHSGSPDLGGVVDRFGEAPVRTRASGTSAQLPLGHRDRGERPARRSRGPLISQLPHEFALLLDPAVTRALRVHRGDLCLT